MVNENLLHTVNTTENKSDRIAQEKPIEEGREPEITREADKGTDRTKKSLQKPAPRRIDQLENKN